MRYSFNQKGLTLVEMLAVIALLSVTMVFIFSMQLTSNQQYTLQTKQNTEIADLSYTLKMLTKDLRKAGKSPIINDNTYTIGSAIYTFDASTASITRNATPIAYSITDFTIQQVSAIKYKISITSTNEQIDTEIVIRSGG